LQIYHDGSNSYIDDAGTGNLYVRGDDVIIGKYTGETFLFGNADGEVRIYYDGSEKFATTATGIDVTGTVVADGLTVDSVITLGQEGVYDAFINSPESFYINIDSDGTQTGRKFQIGTNSTGVSATKILTASDNGDISFYEDTGTTAKFFWDASAESLSIGTTTAPSSSDVKQVMSSAGGAFTQYSYNGGAGGVVGSADVGYLDFFTYTGNIGSEAYTRRMTIDSSGNVGIGVSSIVNPGGSRRGLQLSNSTNGGILFLNNNASEDQNPRVFGDITNTTDLGFAAGGTTGTIIYYTNNTEAMRIDTSGNLLVGTTSFTGTSGVSLSATGYVYASSTNDVAIYANRETSDGDIAVFRKDGTTVGSIGTKTSMLTIGSGDVGLYFDSGNNRIIPFDTTAQVNNDAVFDIGAAAYRLKDLYLSGGVVFGDAGGSGTPTANTLDSYEEGTWTPVMTGSAGSAGSASTTVYGARYTKVGNLVTVMCYIRWSDIGSYSGTIIGDKQMALTEATLQDKIEIVGDYKHVQVRTATVISRDGVEISRSFSRHVVSPLDDISGESAEVQAICAVVHTDEVKAAYTELLAQQAQGV
jgi:hypothetical protein